MADESRGDGELDSSRKRSRAYMEVEERLHARADEEENVTRSLALVMKQVLKALRPCQTMERTRFSGPMRFMHL